MSDRIQSLFANFHVPVEYFLSEQYADDIDEPFDGLLAYSVKLFNVLFSLSDQDLFNLAWNITCLQRLSPVNDRNRLCCPTSASFSQCKEYFRDSEHWIIV